MPRDNRCMYIREHVSFYVCCNDCVGSVVMCCCVSAVVENSVFFFPWSVEVCCVFVVADVMDVVFSVCIVRAWRFVGARVWEV